MFLKQLFLFLFLLILLRDLLRAVILFTLNIITVQISKTFYKISQIGPDADFTSAFIFLPLLKHT